VTHQIYIDTWIHLDGLPHQDGIIMTTKQARKKVVNDIKKLGLEANVRTIPSKDLFKIIFNNQEDVNLFILINGLKKFENEEYDNYFTWYEYP